jgi:cytoskeleton protein RodZ
VSVSNPNSLVKDQPLLEKPSKIEDTSMTADLGQSVTPAFSGTQEELLNMLKLKREEKHYSLQDVEQRLKFKAKWVELLEAGDWSHLPKGASLRGFVKNYSKLIDIDPDILCNALAIDFDKDRHSIGRHTSTRALGDTFKMNSFNVKPIFWVVAGLIVVVVLVFLMINSGVFSASQLPDSLKKMTQ